MPNPTTRWDRVPVFGVWLKVDDTPSPGKVAFGVGQRVTRVDGREIYPEGAQLEVTIGKQDEQDATVRSTVRAAWRAADAAAAGASFDAVAWDTRWDTVIVPAAIFARFPAADDPDIVQSGYTVTVSERLASGKGKSYSIQPLLSQLDLPVPGINLGLVEVPPDATSTPAPVYAKGVPGGVAALDADGNVINAHGVVVLPAGEPAAGSVTNTTISPTAAIELTKTVDAGDRLAMTASSVPRSRTPHWPIRSSRWVGRSRPARACRAAATLERIGLCRCASAPPITRRCVVTTPGCRMLAHPSRMTPR